jgi:hypothetical protein
VRKFRLGTCSAGYDTQVDPRSSVSGTRLLAWSRGRSTGPTNKLPPSLLITPGVSQVLAILDSYVGHEYFCNREGGMKDAEVGSMKVSIQILHAVANVI